MILPYFSTNSGAYCLPCAVAGLVLMVPLFVRSGVAFRLRNYHASAVSKMALDQ